MCLCVCESAGWFLLSTCNSVLAVFLAVDVKTDDRAKMSVAAKMSLFKVGETRAHHISLATAAGWKEKGHCHGRNTHTHRHLVYIYPCGDFPIYCS